MTPRHLTKRALEFIACLIGATFLLVVATDDDGQPPVLGAVLAWTIIAAVVALFVWLAAGELRARRAERRADRRAFERYLDGLHRATVADRHAFGDDQADLEAARR